MSDEDKLTEFKDKYCQALSGIPLTHPIISSMGKQSCGKSQLLGKLFQDESIPNKLNKLVTQGTHYLFSKSFNDYLLIDSEGLENEGAQNERDFFNMSTVLSISDIVLLHITQNDLENQIFQQTFSYLFWQCSRISKKYREKFPKIILLIRDPRNEQKSIETINFYKDLVERFKTTVNQKMKGYSQEFVRALSSVLIKDRMEAEEKKQCESLIEKLEKEMNQDTFDINSYYLIYFQKYLETEGVSKYFELKQNNETFHFCESNFQSLFDFLNAYCLERNNENKSKQYLKSEPLFDLENEITVCIQQTLFSSSQRDKRKEKLIENICIDSKYDIFLHFRNFEGFLTAIRTYYEFYTQFEKMSGKISKKVKNNLDWESKLKLQSEHELELVMFLSKRVNDEILKEKLIKYLKYLSAKCFCDNLSLIPLKPDYVCYQTLQTIFKFNEFEFNEHQLKMVKQTKELFECLSYYDDEFISILKVCFSSNFQIFYSLFTIYKQIIQESLEDELEISVNIDEMIANVNNTDYINYVIKFLKNFEDIVTVPLESVVEFVNHLKNIQKKLLLNKKRDYMVIPEKFEFIHKEKTEKIYSFSILECLLPSLNGLLIGIVTSLARSILIKAAVAATTIWIPVVGWAIFGVTVGISTAKIILDFTNPLKTVKLTFSYDVEEGFCIVDSFSKKSVSYGQTKKELEVKTDKKYKYSIEMTHNITTINSAYIKVKCL